MKYSRYKFFSLLFAAFTMLAAASCSSSDDAGGEPTAVSVDASFVLSPRAAAVEGESYDADATHPNELINTWWIVFIQNGKVVKILDRTRTGAVEEERFTVKLTAGTYDVIAFANITREELTAKTGLTYTEGQPATLQDAKDVTWAMANNGLKQAEDNIPMSGFREGVNVSEGSVYDIEVVRMVAKVELQIKNNSKKGLTLTDISFGSLNQGAIPLMPVYDELAKRPSWLTGTGTPETVSFTGLNQALAVSDMYRHVFYVRESVAETVHPTGRYFVTLRFQRDDGAIAEEHYAVTDELQWIQRNDHIIIPISITDLSVDWEVQFYPPIGGYPAVAKRVDGDDHFFTFGTQGKFVIRPMVRLADGSLLPPSAFDFTITSTEGDAAIFTKSPSKDSVTGEILGELSTSTGTAILNCTLTVTINGEKQTRVRKIYIIRA